MGNEDDDAETYPDEVDKEDIYDEDYVETLEEDDEISPEEEGFMKGYRNALSDQDEEED